MTTPVALVAELAAATRALTSTAPVDIERGSCLKELMRRGLARLPQPGAGQTLVRWQALAAVAAQDLALAKVYEGHTDAVSILVDAGVSFSSAAAWGMWAAESPAARVIARGGPDGRIVLDGVKAWCSGARQLDQGLLTCWGEHGDGPWLASVELSQPGVSFDDSSLHAVGMVHSATVDVRFDGASARRIGSEGFYLNRSGFWQGGIGIAACWHGGACALADALHIRARQAPDAGWHRLLALGVVDRVLSANAALLREAAAWVDAHPHGDARAWALRTRAAADECAQVVLSQVTRALGAAPLCRDAAFARRAADLPVFIRQCHGDRDLVALGECVRESGEPAWQL